VVKWSLIRAIAWGTLALASAMAAAVFAPYVYVELWPRFHSVTVVNSAPVHLMQGRMFDDYFAVEDLGEGTYAIGEPHYYQANYAYLIIGEARALLFDAGSGTRSSPHSLTCR
jgi:hydroxyacylglutathione hydrolase